MDRETGAGRAPVAWPFLLGLALMKLAVHTLSGGMLTYGYMTDELYYLDCADHLAWGYVDHPPLSVAVLWLVRVTLGDSLMALRLLPALAGGATVVLVGLMARELGGGRVAQGLAALATLVSPVYLGVGAFYSMNAFEPALWALAAYLLLRLHNGAPFRVWLLLGVVIGAGLLNKISMLWFGFGLVVGMVLTPQRRWLRTPRPWLAGAIAVVLFAPHIIWQVQNGWPTLEFMRNATQHKLTPKSPLAFLGEQVLIMHPLVVPFWFAGLLYYFVAKDGRPFRLLAWIWVSVFLLLITSGAARSNYIGPAYSILLASGGVVVERLAEARSWRWLPPAVAGIFAVGGTVVAPMAVDLLPPAQYIVYERAIGLSAPRDQVEAIGALPLHFALKFHASAVMQAVSAAYAALPPDDQKRVAILATSFGEAGAINFFGPKLGLPHAIGTHNNYWLWGPGAYTGEVMLVLAGSDGELRRLCGEVELASPISCEYCMPELTTKSVYVCRRLRRPLSEIWPKLRNYI
jgi:hypothetical protein